MTGVQCIAQLLCELIVHSFMVICIFLFSFCYLYLSHYSAESIFVSFKGAGHAFGDSLCRMV